MTRTYDLYTTDRGTGARAVHPEAFEAPYFELPDNWEELTEDELNLWATKAGQERRAATRMPDRGLMCAVPGCTKGHEHVAAEPKGWHTSKDMPTTDNTKVDREHLFDGSQGCPCCGESVANITFFESIDSPSDDWACSGCMYTPTEVQIDTTEEAPMPQGFKHKGFATYHDAESAAEKVIYHEGEPVVPEAPAVTGDAYPSKWDMYAVLPPVRRDPVEERRESVRRDRGKRLERFAQSLLMAHLDAELR